MTDPVSRPVLSWHGGKWRLAPWIIGHFPAHRIYVEPFGGAASVLMRKPRAYAEVYNDLDDLVAGLFRVLRDPALAEELIDQLRLTPFSRVEFEQSIEPSEGEIEQARRLIVRSLMGFGSDSHSMRSTGFRSNSKRYGTTPAHDWASYPDALDATIERLTGVVIENRDAREVMRQHDSPETLYYVDPPYLPETRSPANKYDLKRRAYRHELTRADHVDLLEFLAGLTGMVVLSGYPNLLYDATLPDWLRVEKDAFADGARARTEVLWINPAAAEARRREGDAERMPLFAEAK